MKILIKAMNSKQNRCLKAVNVLVTLLTNNKHKLHIRLTSFLIRNFKYSKITDFRSYIPYIFAPQHILSEPVK